MEDDLLLLVKFFCGFCKQNWPLQLPLGDDDDDEIKKNFPPIYFRLTVQLKGKHFIRTKQENSFSTE